MLALLLALTPSFAADEAPTSEAGEERLIKVLQPKAFLKMGRAEVAPHAGAVTNDPFLHRRFLGASAAYHVTEVFAVEVQADFAPDLGEADWKPVTRQLISENNVAPDLSRMIGIGSVSFAFAPIYGKLAVRDSIIGFDLFGTAGAGIAATQDDLGFLEGDLYSTTANQVHPTTNFGGGLRVVLGDDVALRFDARSIVYIETVGGTTLEMKNNFALAGGVSFFLPGRG